MPLLEIRLSSKNKMRLSPYGYAKSGGVVIPYSSNLKCDQKRQRSGHYRVQKNLKNSILVMNNDVEAKPETTVVPDV